MILDQDRAIFWSVKAQKPWNLEGLEIPIIRILRTEKFFSNCLDTWIITHWRHLDQKKSATLLKILKNWCVNFGVTYIFTTSISMNFSYCCKLFLAKISSIDVKLSVQGIWKKKSSMRKILTIGISRPFKVHGFWAVTDQKMAQSWCKTIISQTISSFSWLLSLKYWFLSLKKEKADMVKMCVTPKFTHQFWRIFNNVADIFWSRCLQWVLIQVSSQFEKNLLYWKF